MTFPPFAFPRPCRLSAAIAALLFMAACSSTPLPPPPLASSADTQRIIITGFTCGDNCYLEYRFPDDPEDKQRSALCTGPCAAWFDDQHMPPEIIGRLAAITLGTGAQVNSDGEIMSRGFPAINALTLEPPR